MLMAKNQEELDAINKILNLGKSKFDWRKNKFKTWTRKLQVLYGNNLNIGDIVLILIIPKNGEKARLEKVVLVQ